MTIREYNKTQEYLFPKRLSDYANHENNCFIAENVVEGLKKDPKFRKALRNHNRKHGSKLIR
ncbi:MAG: hypothetical protein LBC39_03620 [Methanobrevibacter sp.]|jgi:hypothetical protein|nr:hypothetical protein [Candidatus Methanovirga aequatorialis]